MVLLHAPLVRAIDNFLCLQRAIREPAGLLRLIAWDERWFRRAVAVPVALVFAVALLYSLYAIDVQSGERPLAWGTLCVAFFLLYGVGETILSVMLLALESRVLRDCDYELYGPSPLDTVAVRRAIRGSSQLGFLVSLIATTFIVGFVALLEDRHTVVMQLGLFLVGLAYLATLAGVLLPRISINAVALRDKERRLLPLQHELSALAARMGDLTEAQYARYRRLKEVHDTIRDANEEVLPLRALGRLVGALVIPTLTFIASRFGETILQTLLHQGRR